jgi:hypothetical protein
MTTESKSQSSTNQILLWVGMAIVLLGVMYFAL